MRLRHIFTIYLKELKESLRDRRTLFMMVGLPILLYPILIVGMSRLQENQRAVQDARPSNVAVWGEFPPALATTLKDKAKIDVTPWAAIPPEIRAAFDAAKVSPPSFDARPHDPDEPPKAAGLPDAAWSRAAREVIIDRKVDAILIAWPGAAKSIETGGAGRLTVLFDSVRPESQRAQARIRNALDGYRLDTLEAREKARGLKSGFTTPVMTDTQDVAPQKRRSGMLLGSLLPYLLIMFSVMSGFYAAIDVTAGEKERGTMQTLLCAPLEPIEIISGKFLAVWSISLIGTVVNIVSLAMTFSRINLIPGLATSLPLSSYFVAFLMLMPISLLMNALFLAVGAFAKDFKDGQNYLTPMLMALLVPLSATIMPGIEMNAYLAFTPIINIALLIKGVFLGEWTGEILFLTLLSSFAYAGLALMLASKIFERNNLLLGGHESITSIFDFRRRPGLRPTPGISVFVFSVVLVLAFYGSTSLLRYGIPAMLLVTQWGFFFLPPVLLTWAKGFNWKDTFSLRPLSGRGIVACTLIGLSGWTIGGGLLVRLMPPPESLVKALSKILLFDDKSFALWQVWLLIAITPAICEETLFRGLILSGFRRMGKWPAILATGLVFGLAHSSIYRLLPTLFLGIIFSYAVWRTGSIFAGMLCHALNNGLMATMSHSRDLAQSLGLGGHKFLPWEYIAAGSVVFVLGVLLLTGVRPAARSQSESAADATA